MSGCGADEQSGGVLVYDDTERRRHVSVEHGARLGRQRVPATDTDVERPPAKLVVYTPGHFTLTRHTHTIDVDKRSPI